MKKASQILKEMGFRPDSSNAVKEAFIRHLVKSATGVDLEPGPNERRSILEDKVTGQLQFNFDQGVSTNEESQPTSVPDRLKKTS